MIGHKELGYQYLHLFDGDLFKTFSFQLKASYEPINNFFLIGLYEFKNENFTWLSKKINSNYFSLQAKIEY